MPETLKQALDRFDERKDGFQEMKVFSALIPIRKQSEKSGEAPSEELIAESIAFEFCENYSDSESAWGTYFGPAMVFSNEDGKVIESPSIRCVTQQTLDYWKTRAEIANHPTLKARYASLVWDFSKIVTGKSADFRMAQCAVDAIIEIADKQLYKYKSDVCDKLEHAMSLALSLRDSVRVEAVRDAVINFEIAVSDNNQLGTWGFSFDQLIENKKVPLRRDQENKIISDLETKLGQVGNISAPDSSNIRAAEMTSLRLARYYRRSSKTDDVQRVIRKYRDAVLKLSENVAPLVACAFLQQIYDVLLQFGMKDDADNITIHLRTFGQKASRKMKTITHEYSISDDEIERYVGGMTDGCLDDVLKRIAAHYIPDLEKTIEEIQNNAKQSPLVAIIPRTIVDHEGRPVAQIGPISSDMDGHIVKHISQNMSFSAPWLRWVVEKMQGKKYWDVTELLEWFYRSPIFIVEREDILKSGLNAYTEGNWLIAIHLLVPQIEELIRNLVRMSGGIVLKQGKNGSIMYKSLDELLRDDSIKCAFGDSGENVALYFRILLTDQRGWNIRNSVSHGLLQASAFEPHVVDRLFHILLLLGLLHQEESEPGK